MSYRSLPASLRIAALFGALGPAAPILAGCASPGPAAPATALVPATGPGHATVDAAGILPNGVFGDTGGEQP